MTKIKNEIDEKTVQEIVNQVNELLNDGGRNMIPFSFTSIELTEEGLLTLIIHLDSFRRGHAYKAKLFDAAYQIANIIEQGEGNSKQEESMAEQKEAERQTENRPEQEQKQVEQYEKQKTDPAAATEAGRDQADGSASENASRDD